MDRVKPRQGEIYLANNGVKYYVEEMSEGEDEGESYFSLSLVEYEYKDDMDAPAEDIFDEEWYSFVRMHGLKKIVE